MRLIFLLFSFLVVASLSLAISFDDLEARAVNNPADHAAWVQLGNAYFDSDMPEEAIEAYQKALNIKPKDANVLADQGVMYRRLGLLEQAEECFNQALNVNPKHLPVLYNLGVLYRYDMHDYKKAKAAWEKFLNVNPNGDDAERVRNELREMLSEETERQVG
jgi:tetratricopeptide (TPR) repeat protein